MSKTITKAERKVWRGTIAAMREHFKPSEIDVVLDMWESSIDAIDALEADNTKLRKALKHYTDAAIPHDDENAEDDGEIARKALKGKA